MENKGDSAKQSTINSMANAVIGSVIAITMLPIIRGLLSTTDPLDTSMAIMSPNGKPYFFPYIQALRIVRRQQWSFARLAEVNRWECIKAIFRHKKVYIISPSWE